MKTYELCHSTNSLSKQDLFVSHKVQSVADSKGDGGAAAPSYWLIFFSKSHFFPCKRHIFRCAHLQ